MKRGATFIAFLLSSLLTFFSTYYFPEYRIVAFAPLLAIRLNRFSYFSMLWLCIASGLIADLASVHYRFGISSFCYIFASSCVFPFRRQFFEAKLIPNCILTYLISSLVTFQLLLISLYKGTFQFPGFFFFFKEVFFSSLFDVLVGFIFIFIPLKLYEEIKGKGFKRFLLQKSEH